VQASAPPGGVVLDVFAGSGTTGAAALLEGRRFIMVDCLVEAFDVMRRRFEAEATVCFEALPSAAESCAD
jgi:site-specific DNA-methyltransferase (adenine-specific)